MNTLLVAETTAHLEQKQLDAAGNLVIVVRVTPTGYLDETGKIVNSLTLAWRSTKFDDDSEVNSALEEARKFAQKHGYKPTT